MYIFRIEASNVFIIENLNHHKDFCHLSSLGKYVPEAEKVCIIQKLYAAWNLK